MNCLIVATFVALTNFQQPNHEPAGWRGRSRNVGGRPKELNARPARPPAKCLKELPGQRDHHLASCNAKINPVRPSARPATCDFKLLRSVNLRRSHELLARVLSASRDEL